MNCRPHGRKTTIGFWMLVAIADAAMLVAAGGRAAMLLVLAGIVLVVGTVVAVRRLPRTRALATRMITQRGGMTTEVVARRHA
jgi:hypothetical protein